MNTYVGISDTWGLLRNDQLEYFDAVFQRIRRKLSLREFAIVLRAMERGISAQRVAAALIATPPQSTMH
jgi:hypothetical protein